MLCNIADCWQNTVFCKEFQAVTFSSVENLSLDFVAKAEQEVDVFLPVL